MPKYYLLDENKNLVEGYDKEGFLTLLEQAIEDGDLENIDADSAFVSKFKSLLNGTTHHLEFVTQAQYNQLENDGELVPNTYYFITDDTTAEDLNIKLDQLIDGTIPIDFATNSNHATNTDNTDFTNGQTYSYDFGGETGQVAIPTDAEGYNELKSKFCFIWFEMSSKYIVGIMPPMTIGHYYSPQFIFDSGNEKVYIHFNTSNNNPIFITVEGHTGQFPSPTYMKWKPIR